MAEPERELRRLCAFVGEDYDPAMIDGPRRSRGRVAAEHEWWKGDATGPLDRLAASASGATRDAGRGPALRRAQPGRLPRRARLRRGRRAARSVAIVPAGDALAARYDDVLLRLAAAGRRRRPARSRDDRASCSASEPLVFFGVVGQLDPDRPGPALRRVVDIARLGLRPARRGDSRVARRSGSAAL